MICMSRTDGSVIAGGNTLIMWNLCLHFCACLYLDPLTFHQAMGVSHFITLVCFELRDLLWASVCLRLQRSQSASLLLILCEPSSGSIFILNNI